MRARIKRSKWPLIGYLVLAVAVAGAFKYVDIRGDALTRVLGRQLCRQVAQAEAFKPTKDFPRSLIEQSIRNLQESRRDLGLKPCPRRKEKP